MSSAFKEEYLANPDDAEQFFDMLKEPTVMQVGEAEETYLVIPEKDAAIILYHYSNDAKLITIAELKIHIVRK